MATWKRKGMITNQYAMNLGCRLAAKEFTERVKC